jgi:hypothetical protein
MKLGIPRPTPHYNTHFGKRAKKVIVGAHNYPFTHDYKSFHDGSMRHLRQAIKGELISMGLDGEAVVRGLEFYAQPSGQDQCWCVILDTKPEGEVVVVRSTAVEVKFMDAIFWTTLRKRKSFSMEEALEEVIGYSAWPREVLEIAFNNLVKCGCIKEVGDRRYEWVEL